MRSGERKLTLGLTADLSGKSIVEVAVQRAVFLGDPSDLAALFRNNRRFTKEDREVLARFVEGSFQRGRGRPQRGTLGVFDRGSPEQRAANLVRYDLSEMRKRGERTYGKVDDLIKLYAKKCGAKNEEMIRDALKRGRKKTRA